MFGQPQEEEPFLNDQRQRFILFNISGGIGTGLFYIVYEQIYASLPYQAYAWTLSYMLSIIWQHALHTFMVFGASKGGYWKSLFWTYVSYSIGIIASHFIMFILEYINLEYRIAWLITLVATGCLNYFTVTKSFESVV
eukprot:TRINITY_DN10472_c0_g1_i2.p1 TRINITY_DN10472_c0_g1~~TRINITY_DN10472_c0_g1_i2.p1  ORF type:complete len:138 (+),score=10.37 TRINITY_DN10472_c0_g1_i2:39-452(+)